MVWKHYKVINFFSILTLKQIYQLINKNQFLQIENKRQNINFLYMKGIFVYKREFLCIQRRVVVVFFLRTRIKGSRCYPTKIDISSVKESMIQLYSNVNIYNSYSDILHQKSRNFERLHQHHFPVKFHQILFYTNFLNKMFISIKIIKIS